MKKKVSDPLNILVTGASSGIGYHLCVLLQKQGHDVVGIARTKSSSDTFLYECDVNNGVEVVNIIKKKKWSKVNVIVHNAAIGYYGDFKDEDSDNIEQIFQTNLEAPILLTHRLYPFLCQASASNGAKVIFISSSHARMSTPLFATYTATKAALEGFAKSLEREWDRSPSLLKEKISVLRVSVAPTKTDMHGKLGMNLPSSHKYIFLEPSYVAKRISRMVNSRTSSGIARIGFLSTVLNASSRIRNICRILAPSIGSCRSQIKNAEKEHVLVTGAAGGIGTEFVKYFECNVVVADLPNALEKVESHNEDRRYDNRENIHMPLDLLDRTSISNCVRDMPVLKGVIMNAGVNIVGKFEDIDIEKHKLILRVNLLGPILLLNELHHHKRLTDNCFLTFLSSLSFFVSYPGAASYASAKDGIASFADSIGGLCVFPGPTNTNMAERCSPDRCQSETPEARKNKNRMTPSAVVSSTMNAVNGRCSIVIPGSKNCLFAILGEIFPTMLSYAMKKIIYEKLKDGIILE